MISRFKPITLLLAVFLAVSCGDSNARFVKTAVWIMEKSGLYAEGESWEAAKAKALAEKPASLEEARTVVREALKVAGGKHSFIYTSESIQEDETMEPLMPSVEVRDDGVAIIKLPEFGGDKEQIKAYAHAVLDAVPDSVSGAVIDLRGNSGGNMYPMISAVHRFIVDDQNMLRFRGRKRTSGVLLPFVNKVSGVETMAHVNCPVAILTDSLTASSGEAVLICFRGQAGARSFGGATAGYASANSPFPLPDGSRLVLTTACDVARTGEVFCDDPILPDVPTETPLEDALAWIKGEDSQQ